MTQNGSCRCGAVTYRVAQEQLPQTYACHCLDCQSWSGGAFSLNALLPADRLTVEGPLTSYSHQTPSGSRSVQRVCATCHTRIFNTNEAVPGMVILRAGTLADSQSLEPAAHIWTRRKQSWLRLPADVPAFEETPSPKPSPMPSQAVPMRADKHRDASCAAGTGHSSEACFPDFQLIYAANEFPLEN